MVIFIAFIYFYCVYFYCVYFDIYIDYMISQFFFDLYDIIYDWFNNFKCYKDKPLDTYKDNSKNESLVKNAEYFNYDDIYCSSIDK
jgi:hypothetical protein